MRGLTIPSFPILKCASMGVFVVQAARAGPGAERGRCVESVLTRAPARRSLLQRPVRPLGVAVVDVLVKDESQVPFAGDQHPVRYSRRALAIQRSAIAFARGARIGVFMIRIPAAASTVSNAVVNLASRSRSRYLNPSVRPPRFISRLRACWVTHSPAG